jgi:hypothetical protein
MKSFNDYLKEAALSAKQKKIAAIAGDKDKIDADDLAALRAGKKPVDEASCSGNMKKEELVGNQHKLDKNKNGKLDAHDFKLLRKEETVEEAMCKHEVEKSFPASGVKTGASAPKGTTYMPKDKQKAKGKPAGALGEETLDEGRMKELAMDLKDMSHDEFHKTYGHPKHHYDPTNFKKPVEPGKGMDRAKALAQRGMQSLSKEEVERIEEKLAELDEATYEIDVAHRDRSHTSDPLENVKKTAAKHNLKVKVVNANGPAGGANVVHLTGKKEDAHRYIKKHHSPEMDNDEIEDTHRIRKSVKEEVKQIDELSKDTLGNYVKKAIDSKKNSEVNAKHNMDMYAKQSATGEHPPRRNGTPDAYERSEKHQAKADKRGEGIKLAAKKLAKEEVEQIDELSKKTLGNYVKGTAKDVADRQERIRAGAKPYPGESQADYQKDMSKALALQSKRKAGMDKAIDKLTKEDTEPEMSAYLKATLAVMDEGKIDNLRDAQKLRQDMQSAYDKDYKPDTSHPHIQVVKGNAYGGANQKDDEGDEKPDETKEKKGRGRPTGSKSGARQKGGGHEDGGIPVHNLNLPKSYK